MRQSVNKLLVDAQVHTTDTQTERNTVSLFQYLENHQSVWSRIVVKRNASFIAFRDIHKKYYMGFGKSLDDAFCNLQKRVILP